MGLEYRKGLWSLLPRNDKHENACHIDKMSIERLFKQPNSKARTPDQNLAVRKLFETQTNSDPTPTLRPAET
ncbi:hypothetical protein A2U01_0008302, partial [Trifolium medium]|nr:hypothetical protein [Trifolium medium]